MTPPLMLGIAGGSGCGKTYLANEIQKRAGPEFVSVLSMDQYFQSPKSGELPSQINFDHPGHLDFELLLEHLRSLRSGVAVSCPQYDFKTMLQTQDAAVVEAKPIVIVEGLFVLTEPAVRSFDLTCFLDVEPDQRLLGRILRDLKERGATIEAIVDRYQRFVRPSYYVFVAPTKQNADVVVDFTYRRALFTELLVGLINRYLEGGLEVDEFTSDMRKETYHLGFQPHERRMPQTADIFKLAEAYPESAFPPAARHRKIGTPELFLTGDGNELESDQLEDTGHD